ncbi:unannotated protein [freshwater metagenome]|uniref:Unannotated protein n=1 Tax=freshwater metagenome TaxID=449393 RepID=A0A6J7H987_9ZZZZ
MPLRPVLTLPLRVASRTSTALAADEISFMKSLLVALPVSSSLVAINATEPSIPFMANRAWTNPAFISKIPGPVAAFSLTLHNGVKEPFGQTVSRCASTIISGLSAPHQKTGRPLISRISAGVPNTSPAI